MLPKKLLIILILIVIVILAVGIWFGSQFLAKQNPAGPSEYVAVYMATGDIYYGKLSWFPKMKLRNVWFLQRTLDKNNQPQLGIAPLSTAFWGPVDEIYPNEKQVIFWTYLRRDSQVAKAFANPSLLQQLQPQAPAGVQGPAATSTPR